MLNRLTNPMTVIGNPLPLRIAFAVLLLFSVIFVAEETQASCGDYLVVGGVDHAMDRSGNETSTFASQMPVDAPCHGPQCRQAPNSPILPLPAQLGPTPNEQAHLKRIDDFNATSPFWYHFADASMQLTPGFPFRLERPPQA